MHTQADPVKCQADARPFRSRLKVGGHPANHTWTTRSDVQLRGRPKPGAEYNFQNGLLNRRVFQYCDLVGTKPDQFTRSPTVGSLLPWYALSWGA